MKSKTFLFVLFFIMSVIVSASSKNRIVVGKVTTFKVIAVNKASILVKSTKAEFSSDSTGYFSLVCSNTDNLIFSAKGFFSEKINLKNILETDSVNVDLRLKKGKKNIEYATGYGHISEKRLSYAIVHFGIISCSLPVLLNYLAIFGYYPRLNILVRHLNFFFK